MSDAVKHNTAIADDFSRRSDVILSAQIEECVRQLIKSKKSLTSIEASRIFEHFFGKSAISSLFFEFCVCLNSNMLLRKINFSDRPKRYTVAHMQSANCISAMHILCKRSESVSVVCRDFRNCCDSVSHGRADYCILPVASTDDGVFLSFHKLVKTYDLKICGVCTLACVDREAEMRFALLGRKLESGAASSFIVFSFLPEKDELPCVISVLQRSGCTVTEVNTYPTEFSIDKNECTVCVRCNNVSPAVIIHFLAAVLPGHTILGIY